MKVIGVFPPIPEQKITQYLYQTLARYDNLEDRANELIKYQKNAAPP
jgi:hypothetical protein